MFDDPRMLSEFQKIFGKQKESEETTETKEE
jgi:hypothetical protein